MNKGFLTFSLLVLAISVATRSSACVLRDVPEEHGHFDGDVFGRFVDKDYIDRPLFQLSEPLVYTAPNNTDFTAISDYIVDGASIPRFFWSVVGGPFSGNHLKASVVHDYYTDTCLAYPHQEEDRVCQSELEFFYDDDVVHRNYYLGMLAAGVDKDTACAEYLAVSLYKTWDLDQNGQPTNIKVLGLPINQHDASWVEKSLATVKASIGAVTKTRKYSEGRLLNVFPDGEIEATEEGVSEYLDRLRSSLSDQSYIENPEELGLLTDESYTNIEELAPWPNEFIEPRLDPGLRQEMGLIYFDPSHLANASPLAETLELTRPPAAIFEIPADEEIRLEDFFSDTDSLIRDYLHGDGPTLPESFGDADVQLRSLKNDSGLEYQLSPSLQNYLESGTVRSNLGGSGTILLQEGIGGGQELLLQPSPLR